MYIGLPPEIQVKREFGSTIVYDHRSYINLHNWAMEELNSAPIPEKNVYLKISHEIKKRYGKDHVKIILYNPANKSIIEL